MKRLPIKNFVTLSVILRIVSTIMLLWATSRHKYDYYTIMRVLVTVTSFYCAFLSYKIKNELWILSFLTIALLFNPIAPIKLTKETWFIIDIVIAAFYLISIKYVRELK